MKTAPARDVNSAWGDAKQYAPATDDIDVGRCYECIEQTIQN